MRVGATRRRLAFEETEDPIESNFRVVLDVLHGRLKANALNRGVLSLVFAKVLYEYGVSSHVCVKNADETLMKYNNKRLYDTTRYE